MLTDSTPKPKYCPPSDIDALVLSWLRRCRESQFAHYEVASFYARCHQYFGVPVIAITSIVSASIFSSFQKSENELIKYSALGLSILSIVLSSLQTFMKFAERAEIHRAAGAQYAALRRRLELVHATQSKDTKQIEKIGAEISALALKVPNISQATFERVKKLLQD